MSTTKYINLYNDFINEDKISDLYDEYNMGKTGHLVLSGIVSGFIGIFAGLASANPGIGILVGLGAMALIGGLSVFSYYKAIEQWRNAAELIMEEYGANKDEIDNDKLKTLIKKFLSHSQRVMELKTKLIHLKSKAKRMEQEDAKKASRNPKYKKIIEQIIKYEASDMAAYYAFKEFNFRIQQMKIKFGAANVNSVLPGIYDLSELFLHLMENFNSLSSAETPLPGFIDLIGSLEDENGDVKGKAVTNAVVSYAIRVSIMKEYDKALRVYEQTYSRKHNEFLKEYIEKYKDGIVMKEMLQYNENY